MMMQKIGSMLEFIIKNQPNGLATAESLLVAAVETKCISTGAANKLSNTHKLGLNWDTFTETVERFLNQNDDNTRRLADTFEVSESTVRRWSTGVSKPHPNLCDQVVDYIFPLLAYPVTAQPTKSDSKKTSEELMLRGYVNMRTVFGDDDLPF